MIICSQPECQTTAGCTCTNRLFDYSRLRGEVAAKEAELSALKKQVEELTAERDALEVKAVSLLWAVPGETLCGEVQSLHKRALELQSAEAEAAALRKALIEARAVVDAVTGHNQPDRPWSRQVRDRIDAALASTGETSDAG